MPQDIGNDWKKWINELKLLINIHISQCFKPTKFQINDASSSGYGQASYLHFVSGAGRINCCLPIGKAHIVPIKYITIPRMELVAATLSVKNTTTKGNLTS